MLSFRVLSNEIILDFLFNICYLFVQLRPNFHPEGLFADEKVKSTKSSEGSEPVKQLWHLNGECPEGTIPVRRTKKEDVLRASSIKNYGKKKKNLNILRPSSAQPQPDLITQNGHQVTRTMFV